MACVYGTSIATTLDQELSNLQHELQDVESNLKKLTGRGISSRDTNRDSKRSRRTVDSGGVNGRRRRGYDDSRESTEELDDSPPRKLQSSIVATSNRQPKPREHVLEEQKGDEKSLARNRRMFGMILGTLQKFQSDESRRRPTQREAIERKVEKEAEEEAEHVKKERQELFKVRRQKQAEIRRLHLKMERVEIHQEWEKSQLLMSSFIQTRTKPCIFYIPKKFCPETEKRRKDTKDKYRMIIAEKRARIQKELNEIDDLYTRKERGERDEGEFDENNDEDETNVTKSTVQIVSSDANVQYQENPPSTKGRKSPTRAEGTKGESCERKEESSGKNGESSEKNGESRERKEEGDVGSHERSNTAEFEPIYDE